MITRRAFMKNGVAAFTVSIAAPAFLSDLARAQGAVSRNLVVLDLSGGNDGLSMLVPYTDSFYYSRRPTLAVPAGSVLQIGSDASGKPLGLHPKLAGLKDIFNQGRLALIQRVGYQNSSRSHFFGTDIWSTANPASSAGSGWVGRYLATLAPPLDPLVAWNTTGETPHALQSSAVAVASIPSVSGYAFNSPNSGAEAMLERSAAASIASHVPVDQPHVAFVSTTAQAAMATLDRVSAVGGYKPTVAYPNNGFGQALQAIAGAMVQGIGTKVFWVQTGGFDTHAGQDTTADNGAYVKLMATLNDGLSAFYADLKNHALLGDTLLLSFSEFGRRVTENGSKGTDHGAASVMLAMGGGVRGGLFGTAASLNPDAQNPTLENNGADIHYETDFRSVYARVIDGWLGGDSVAVLGGSFKNGPAFV
ncbi:MAG TPA: DUF1501 domain-containing protein [Vicinamibacterales bacterium]|jgi:uncharacterized protein (DUF1501 family)|nr:DUF1501 domain-containing protein [Vicinamibacterales bacterium]